MRRAGDEEMSRDEMTERVPVSRATITRSVKHRRDTGTVDNQVKKCRGKLLKTGIECLKRYCVEVAGHIDFLRKDTFTWLVRNKFCEALFERLLYWSVAVCDEENISGLISTQVRCSSKASQMRHAPSC
jgi:hypothetical protein